MTIESPQIIPQQHKNPGMLESFVNATGNMVGGTLSAATGTLFIAAGVSVWAATAFALYEWGKPIEIPTTEKSSWSSNSNTKETTYGLGENVGNFCRNVSNMVGFDLTISCDKLESSNIRMILATEGVGVYNIAVPTILLGGSSLVMAHFGWALCARGVRIISSAFTMVS